MLGRYAFVADHKQVFIVSLHKVLLPGIFLQDCRIGFQVFQLLFGGGDLLFVVLFALLQLLQFAPLPEMTGDEIPIVEEQNPDRKAYCRQQVFVLQPGWDMRQQAHKKTDRGPAPAGPRSKLQLIF